MSPDRSLTDLLPDLAAGNSAATAAVWDHYFASLCRIAHQQLLDRQARAADEEDVALSALASVCRRFQRGEFPDINNSDDLWRLLVTVTKRKAINLLRDEGRQKRGGGKISGESVVAGMDSSAGQGLDAFAATEPPPELVASMSETIERMFAVLDDQEQRVATLKMEGYRNDDIAQQLGRSVATIERKLKLIRSAWSVFVDDGGS